MYLCPHGESRALALEKRARSRTRRTFGARGCGRDAAASNSLRSFIAEGADLVTFSGGKADGAAIVGHPGRASDLIRAERAEWQPNHSIGRAAKAAKEDIVGLGSWRSKTTCSATTMRHRRVARPGRVDAAAVERLPRRRRDYLHDGREHPVPRVELRFGPASGINAHELVVALEEHDRGCSSSNQPGRALRRTVS